MQTHKMINLETFNALKDQMGADFVLELIDTYLVETSGLVEQLPAAFTSGDCVTFTRTAHSIKSSSASFGAFSFADQARELEMMGKANDLSQAGPKIDLLAASFLLVQQHLEALKNEP